MTKTQSFFHVHSNSSKSWKIINSEFCYECDGSHFGFTYYRIPSTKSLNIQFDSFNGI
jgi:hypothetical protein